MTTGCSQRRHWACLCTRLKGNVINGKLLVEMAEIRKLLGAAAPSTGAVKAGTVQFVTNCVPAGRCASVKSEGKRCLHAVLADTSHRTFASRASLFSMPSWFPAQACACEPMSNLHARRCRLLGRTNRRACVGARTLPQRANRPGDNPHRVSAPGGHY